MERKPVKSSNIKSMGYNSNRQILEVEFYHGGIYRYQPVSEEEYTIMMNSESIGTYFSNTIRTDKEKKCTKVG